MTMCLFIGIINYCERYGDMIHDISSRMGPTPKLDPNSPAAKSMEKELVTDIPVDKLNERRK